MKLGNIDKVNKIEKVNDKYLSFTLEDNDLVGLCDNEGNIIFKNKYIDFISVPGFNFMLCLKEDDQYYIIKKGLTDNLNLSGEGYVSYEIVGKYMILNSFLQSGSTPVKAIFDSEGSTLGIFPDSLIYYLDEDMFLIRQSEKYILFNAIKREKIPFNLGNIIDYKKYSLQVPDILKYHGGLMTQPLDYGKYRLVDTEGEQFGYSYSYASRFKRTYPSGKYMAIVEEYPDLMVMDNNGVILFTLDSNKYKLKQTKYDLFILDDQEKIFNQYGVIDLFGRVIVPCDYEKVEVTANGICICHNGNRIDYFNSEGNKLDIDKKYTFNEDDNNSHVCILYDTNGENNKYVFMNSNGELLFDGKGFDTISGLDKRIIATRQEVSYDSNIPVKYTSYSLIDRDLEKMMFRYPADDKGNMIYKIKKIDEEHYLVELNKKYYYQVIDKDGNLLFDFYSEEEPVIKDSIIIATVLLHSTMAELYGTEHFQRAYRLDRKDYLRDDLGEYDFDNIQVVSNNLLVTEGGRKDTSKIDGLSALTIGPVASKMDIRRLCKIVDTTEVLSLVSVADISKDKSIVHKIRRRLLRDNHDNR